MNEQRLPMFDETSLDIPEGYGVEHSHDGNWYAYRVPVTGVSQSYLKDGRGLDLVCYTRDEALTAIKDIKPGENDLPDEDESVYLTGIDQDGEEWVYLEDIDGPMLFQS